MDEPFALREIFQIDSSFAPGSREIGFDVKADRGKARLTSMTNTSGDNIPKSDMSIGRNLQAVGKIDTYIEVTRDEAQEIELKNDRGMGPLVDLMSGKLETARKSVNRVEDQLGFQGGSFDDAQVDGEILGYFDSFSTVQADFLGDNPSKGKREDIPGPSLKWTDPLKTPEEFISDLKPALQYLTRNNSYKPRAFGLPPEILSCLIMKKVSPADSTPLLTWLIQTINAGYGVDLQVFTTNALTLFENSGTTNGFVLLDNSKSNMAIGSVEEIIMLPPVIDKTQTTEQVVQLKTGGMQVKQPASGYLGTDI